MNALMLLLISISGSDEMQRILFWLMGDFSLADYQKIMIAGVVTGLGWLAIYLNANRLNVLISGDDTAHHLGLNVFRARTFFIATAALITGTIVSVSGTVGFVGLVVPHAMRLLFGSDSRVLLPAAFLGGAAFLAASDCVARVVAYPVELPGRGHNCPDRGSFLSLSSRERVSDKDDRRSSRMQGSAFRI